MRLILAVLTAWLAGATPVAAVTLEPGEYKLEWQVTALDKAGDTFMSFAGLKPLTPDEVNRFKSLASDKPLSAVIRGLRVILDESRGAQTGYDTAYLVPAETREPIDLARLTSIPLQDRSNLLCTDETKPDLVDISVGQGESARKVKIGVVVQASLQRQPEGGRLPVAVALLFVGQWTTRIPSDGGPVELQVIDKNGNGLFDDAVSRDAGSNAFKPGDVLALKRNDGEWQKTLLGKTLLYEGKLYLVKVCFDKLSATGSGTIEIKPYTGETGVLRFETLDGKNQLVKAGDVMSFLSPEIGTVDIKSGEEATVPVGDYQPRPSITFGERKKRGDPGFIATVKIKRVAKVEAGKTCTFAVGGPMRVVIDPETDVYEWSRGENVIAKVWIYAGQDDLESLGLPDPPVLIEFRDAAGRLVARSRQTLKFDNPRGFSLRPPESLVPGPHWLIVNVTPGEYQPEDTISDHKPLAILPAK